MYRIRPAAERGHADHGWLRTWHSFSFADYHDPAHMGFRSLRVINEDRIAGGGGFPFHPHRDMEIVTYMLAGGLQHRDDLGNGSVVRRGEIQRMSAGRGIVHGEFNPSPDEESHLLQIWIRPDRRGIAPSWEEKAFPDDEKRGRWRPLVAPDGREGALVVQQDALLFASLLERGEELVHDLDAGRGAWLQVASGRVETEAGALGPGDGLAVEGETGFRVSAREDAELLLFDLA
ncbi:MAG: pirin family protein [Planctomycetota bacterium]